jgi:uncharacterized protein (DUF983 family)
MKDDVSHPPVDPIGAGLRARCPRCGKGPLFKGFLSLRDGCPQCGLDYGFADPGDGAVVPILLIAGFIVTGGAMYVELVYQPPYWVHAMLWLPIGIFVPALMLRPVKAMFITLQYAHKAQEGRLTKDSPKTR